MQAEIKENNEIKLDEESMITPIKLNSNWVFWYASRKEKDHHISYDERLMNIAEFNTMDEFFKYYLYLKGVPEIERNTDLGLFKKGYRPLWESCPDGGCWFIRYKKTDETTEIDNKWEKLLFALVGEQFEEPNMLGAVLSIRGRETIIELWFNYFKYDQIKNGVAQKMRSLLMLDHNFTVYFKDNEKSLQDKSTLRNAETYSFVQQRKSTFN